MNGKIVLSPNMTKNDCEKLSSKQLNHVLNVWDKLGSGLEGNAIVKEGNLIDKAKRILEEISLEWNGIDLSIDPRWKT